MILYGLIVANVGNDLPKETHLTARARGSIVHSVA